VKSYAQVYHTTRKYGGGPRRVQPPIFTNARLFPVAAQTINKGCRVSSCTLRFFAEEPEIHDPIEEALARPYRREMQRWVLHTVTPDLPCELQSIDQMRTDSVCWTSTVHPTVRIKCRRSSRRISGVKTHDRPRRESSCSWHPCGGYLTFCIIPISWLVLAPQMSSGLTGTCTLRVNHALAPLTPILILTLFIPPNRFGPLLCGYFF
jgi:hypothetical protein